MAAPILSFFYNTSSSGVSYTGSGGEQGPWKKMILTTVSGFTPDKVVFTGGGLNQSVETPTAAYGRREATLRPNTGTLIIPQTFVESETDSIMRHVPDAGKNANRYPFCVYIDGYCASDLYLEAWDNNSFNSTDITTLSGSLNYPWSMFNAISTTSGTHIADWDGTTYSGTDKSGRLSGYSPRVRLKGVDEIQDESVYYNIYVELTWDMPLTHDTPVLAFRYLYI